MVSNDPLTMARELAAQFATRADQADRDGRLPPEDVQALRESGYLKLPIPRQYGGYGLGLADCVAAHLELAQGSASTAMLAAMPLQVFGSALEAGSWSEAHLERFSRAVVEQGALFNIAASEPAMGSPSRGQFYASRAVRVEDGWCITGHKTWITGGRHLTHVLVKLMAEGEPGVIVVENNRAGIEWRETWHTSLSLRASDSHDLYLHDVIVPAENLVERGEGAKLPNAWFPMLVAAVYLGSALAARRAVIEYALERVPTALGKPIATLPKIQRQIGELDIPLQAARLLLLDAAKAWSENPTSRPALYPRIAAAKHYAVETAIFVTDLALKIAGGAAITTELPLERYFRDVRAGSMQPPSGDTALEIVGRGAIAQVEHEFAS